MIPILSPSYKVHCSPRHRCSQCLRELPPTPGTICASSLSSTSPGRGSSRSYTPPYPPTCHSNYFASTYQCVDGGVGCSQRRKLPGLGYSFHYQDHGGDSIVSIPGRIIPVQVTAPAGTVLHFMCVIHPWMQGEIIVTA